MGSLLTCWRKGDLLNDCSDVTENQSVRSFPSSRSARSVSRKSQTGKHVQFSAVVETRSPWGSTRILDADLRAFGFRSIDEHARQARLEDAATFTKLLEYLKSWTPPDDEPSFTPVEPIIIRSLYGIPSAMSMREEEEGASKTAGKNTDGADRPKEGTSDKNIVGTDKDGESVTHPSKPDSPRETSVKDATGTPSTPQPSGSRHKHKEPKSIKLGLLSGKSTPVVEKLPADGTDSDIAIIDAVQDANIAENIFDEQKEGDADKPKRKASTHSKTSSHVELKSNGVGVAGVHVHKARDSKSQQHDSHSKTSKHGKSGDTLPVKGGDGKDESKVEDGPAKSLSAQPQSSETDKTADIKTDDDEQATGIETDRKGSTEADRLEGTRKSSVGSETKRPGSVRRPTSASVDRRPTSASRSGSLDRQDVGMQVDRLTSASTTASSTLPDPDRSMLYLVRGLLVWMISHVDMDLQDYDDEDDEEESPLFLLQLLQDGFISQAEMFSSLCLHADIFCEVIPGRCKGDNYVPGDMVLSDDSWNAVFLAGGWRLIHPEWFSRGVQYFRRRKPKAPIEVKMAVPPGTSDKPADEETKTVEEGDKPVDEADEEDDAEDQKVLMEKEQTEEDDSRRDDNNGNSENREWDRDKSTLENTSTVGEVSEFRVETRTTMEATEDSKTLASGITGDQDLVTFDTGETPHPGSSIQWEDSRKSDLENTTVHTDVSLTVSKDTLKTDFNIKPSSSEGRRSVGFETDISRDSRNGVDMEDREWDERWRDYEYPVPQLVKPSSAAISVKSILKKDTTQENSSPPYTKAETLTFAEPDILSFDEPPTTVSVQTQQVQTIISSLHSSRKSSAASSRRGSARRPRSVTIYPSEPPDPRKTVGQEVPIERTLAKLGMSQAGSEAAPHGYSDFWFITSPEQFVYWCFPDERKWQLLGRDRVVRSCNEFIQMPRLYPAFFELGLILTSDGSCSLGSWYGVCTIHLEQMGFTPRRMHLLHDIIPVAVDEPEFVSDADLSKLVFYSRSQDSFSFEIRFPTAGVYRFIVVGYEHGSKKKQKCCEFTINCSKRLRNCQKLPIDPGQLGWGYGPCAEDVGLYQPSHLDPKIRIRPLRTGTMAPHIPFRHVGCHVSAKIDTSLTLTFQIEEDKAEITLYRTLLLNDDLNPKQVAALQEHVRTTVDAERCVLTIDVTVPVNGEYALVIQAARRPRRPRGKEMYFSVCNYLLTTLEENNEEINHERRMNRNVVLDLVSLTEQSIQRLTNFNFKEDLERRAQIETQLKEFVRFIDNPFMRAIMNELIVKLQRAIE